MGGTTTEVAVDLRDAFASLGDMPAASSALLNASSSSSTCAVVMAAMAGERGVPAADTVLLLARAMLRCSRAELAPRLRLLVLLRKLLAGLLALLRHMERGLLRPVEPRGDRLDTELRRPAAKAPE